MRREGYLERRHLAGRLHCPEAYAKNKDAMHRNRQKHREIKTFALVRARVHFGLAPCRELASNRFHEITRYIELVCAIEFAYASWTSDIDFGQVVTDYV